MANEYIDCYIHERKCFHFCKECLTGKYFLNILIDIKKKLERHNKPLTFTFLEFINILLWYNIYFKKGESNLLGRQGMRKRRREKGTRESRENS